MKNISFFVAFALALTAFGNPNPFEKRLDPTCIGELCGLPTPVTLTIPITAATTVTLLVPPTEIAVGATIDFTTTIGACSSTDCTCVSATDPITTIPVDVNLPHDFPVTIPGILTTDVPLPSVTFTGGITVPSVTVPDIGLCAGTS